MSAGSRALKYTVAAIALAAIIIVASTLYLNPSGLLGQQSGTSSRLIIHLTDPPQVPKGTTSLNLTYSAIALLVGEPVSGGQQTLKTVSITPSGGSATLDLLKLQNVSQTIASASLPNGSLIYSFSFTVTGISIDVNGTKSPVTLATGGSTLTVTLAKPSALQGTDVAMLQLNPVIVSTSSGYQMIPSAVGFVRHASQGEENEQVGSQHQLSKEDNDEFEHSKGNVTATLTAMSVSGNSTTITVQVKNVGNSSVLLNAIAIHGNFTVIGHPCNGGGQNETRTHTIGNHSSSTTSSTSSTTTRTTTTSTSSRECENEHQDEVVFVPVNGTMSSGACSPLKMDLVSGEHVQAEGHGITLAKGQCVDLTFSGVISFGEAKVVLVPSTLSGQVYEVHVIASSGANLELSCELPLGAASCTVEHEEKD
jgi:hypothetical protein